MTFDDYRKGIDGQSWEDNKREREEVLLPSEMIQF